MNLSDMLAQSVVAYRDSWETRRATVARVQKNAVILDVAGREVRVSSMRTGEVPTVSPWTDRHEVEDRRMGAFHRLSESMRRLKDSGGWGRSRRTITYNGVELTTEEMRSLADAFDALTLSPAPATVPTDGAGEGVP